MRRLGALLAGAVLASGVSACGSDPDARMRLRTPPVQSSAEPLPEVKAAQERAERAARRRPSQKDAERVRPVLRGWGDALRHNDYAGAARYFALPAIVARGETATLETAAEVKAFNAGLPCGVKLLRVTHEGRFVVGTFELTLRPAHRCDAPGRRIRVAFVIRDGKIAEWRRVDVGVDEAPGRAI